MPDGETCGWAGAGREDCRITHADLTGRFGSLVEPCCEGAQRRGQGGLLMGR